jgi:hypothetical protein
MSTTTTLDSEIRARIGAFAAELAALEGRRGDRDVGSVEARVRVVRGAFVEQLELGAGRDRSTLPHQFR